MSPTIPAGKPILVVDDEEQVIIDLTAKLRANGLLNVSGCRDSREVVGLARSLEPALILLDLRMPYLSGEELLGELHALFPQLPVIVLTATDEVASAVGCMQAGAVDYMVKPVEDTRLLSGIRRALDIRRLERDYRHLKEKLLSSGLANPELFAPIVTRNRAMQGVFQYVESVAVTAEPILLIGETGVGKNLLARAIHETSGRSGEFIEVNVGGLDDTFFADTLFGHRKGAFTGAPEAREGMIQRAAGGTLLLDEIGDLSLVSQTKLLDLLDTGKYYPLGSDLPRRTDARFIVATNRELERLMQSEKFRTDLYFRLSTYSIRIPPLRDRMEDLPLLMEHFLAAAAERMHREKPAVPLGLLELLGKYEFPGNVRELDNLVRDALARTTTSTLSVAAFREKTGKDLVRQPSELAASLLAFPQRLPTLRQATEMMIAEALRRAGGNQSIAAGWLGISHQALSKRLRNRQPTEE